ncbi:MAG: hypothetical protein WDO19_08840 [Bacteroidota bacterium]
MVIDPTVVFISFSKSAANNWGYTATYGPDGSMFGGGIVFGEGFPTITGHSRKLIQGEPALCHLILVSSNYRRMALPGYTLPIIGGKKRK